MSSKGGSALDAFRLDDTTEARFREVVGHIVDSIDAGLVPGGAG